MWLWSVNAIYDLKQNFDLNKGFGELKDKSFTKICICEFVMENSTVLSSVLFTKKVQ